MVMMDCFGYPADILQEQAEARRWAGLLHGWLDSTTFYFIFFWSANKRPIFIYPSLVGSFYFIIL